MLLDSPAQKKLMGTALERVKTLPEPRSCDTGCSHPDSLKASPSPGSTSSCCRPVTQKSKVFAAGNPFWEAPPKRFIMVTLSPFGQTCWSTGQHSPSPAFHLGIWLVRAHLPSLLAPTPMFLPVGRDRGGEKRQAGAFPGLTQR